MQIEALGYVGVRSDRLDDWASYASRFLGMQVDERSGKSLRLRMDDRKQRLLVGPDIGEGAALFGWEVADAAALDGLAARLEVADVEVRRGDRALASERRVKDLIVFKDPIGTRLEAFHGAESAAEPFKPGRAISGFRTGPLGVGHAVLAVENVEALLPFYREVLGFRLSDWLLKPFKAYFFHVNPRHHSLALIETGRNGIHHFMIELYSLDDVGQGFDLAQSLEVSLGTSIGRHTNDYMTSFYAYTPSGFMVEYGWGGRCIDPTIWQAAELAHGGSMWGHERLWLDAERRQDAREIQLKAAAEGLRQPVQVLAGNYALSAGVCPWWDQAKMKQEAPGA
jgi:2,3-dihydroxybiphenyl 1,2-dioxygenase